MTNEDICLMIQADDSEKDSYLVGLLQKNAVLFKQWVLEAMADAIVDTAKLSPDEMMAEAISGLRRAAEVYRPETGASFIDYAEAWVKIKVRSYVRKAERQMLPDRILSSVQEYRRIIDAIQNGTERGRTMLKKEQISAFVNASLLLLGKDRRIPAVGI